MPTRKFDEDWEDPEPMITSDEYGNSYRASRAKLNSRGYIPKDPEWSGWIEKPRTLQEYRSENMSEEEK